MKKIFTKEVLTGALATVIYLMVANFILHMVTGWNNGLFFDEFYYYSMSDNLAMGYMEVPPVTALLMALSRLLLGDSAWAMNVFPALAGSFAMMFAALTARKMGGGRFSQAITATAVMMAPVFMTFFGMFTYDVFDQLMSAVVILMTAKIIKGEAAPRTWVLFGFIAGIGLMVKITMGFMLLCIIAGILLTRARKYLATKWFAVSVAIAAVCSVPFIVWQAENGFPVFEYLLAYRDARTVSPSAVDMLQYVFIVMNPASVLLWLGGLAMMFTKRGRVFRPFAWAFIAYFILAVVMSVKFYALAGVMLPLVAFGSVCLESNYREAPLIEESLTETPRKRARVSWTLKAAYLAAICLLGAALAPLSIPLLSSKDTAKYNETTGYSRLVRWDTVSFTGIPTFFAARLGWEELAQFVSETYHSLPDDEQEDCTIYCCRYGAAGAVDYYGREYGLPRAASANMGYYYWGHNGFDGTALFVNMGPDARWYLMKYFEDVETVSGSAGVPYSTLSMVEQSICVCRGLKIPADDFWKQMRSYT